MPLRKAHCRSCDAEIFWALTEKGKREPIDFAPVDDGNVEILAYDAESNDPIVRHHAPGALPLMAADRYVSHFATCPHAKQHRKETHHVP